MKKYQTFNDSFHINITKYSKNSKLIFISFRDKMEKYNNLSLLDSTNVRLQVLQTNMIIYNNN